MKNRPTDEDIEIFYAILNLTELALKRFGSGNEKFQVIIGHIMPLGGLMIDSYAKKFPHLKKTWEERP